jgi:hypothetical protein
VASLLTTPGQHFPTGLGLHPGPEAMVLETLPATWISVCRLHDLILRSLRTGLEKPVSLDHSSDPVKLSGAILVTGGGEYSGLVDSVENFS